MTGIDATALLSPTVQRWAGRLGCGALAAPIVIGATGGSGTRAVRALLVEAGLFMGTHVNEPGDAMDFEPLLDDLINPVLAVTRSVDYALSDLPPALRAEGVEALRRQAGVYLAGKPGLFGRWGWKNPRTIYILPFIHALFPRFWFIHVVRDGRDMATSDNQNQLRKHYQAMFGVPASAPEPVESCALWSRVNLDALRWGRRVLGNRHVQLLLEDLCAAPEATVRRLFAALGLPQARAAAAAARVLTPPSLGRWQTLPSDLLSRVEQAGDEGLRQFRYLEAPWQRLPGKQ